MKNKIYLNLKASIIISISVMLVVSGSTVFAQNSENNQIRNPDNLMKIENTAASIGADEVIIPITGIWEEPILAYAISVYFIDESYIESYSLSIDGTIMEGGVLTKQEHVGYFTALLRVEDENDEIPAGEGVLLNIVVNVSDDAEIGDVDFIFYDHSVWDTAYYYSINWQGNKIPANLVNGVLSIIENDDPTQPQIGGPNEGSVGLDQTFSISSTDPDDNELSYIVDWGDETFDEYGPFESGEEFDAIHSWQETDSYDILVTVSDGIGGVNSNTHNIDIINNQPTAPSIDGPTEVMLDTEATFTISAVDSDGHDLLYAVNWGDINIDHYGPFESGEEFEATHTWNNPGDYEIVITVSDGFEGENSNTHDIEVIGLPDLSIKSIEGGTGITAVIENIGDAEATDVQWTITIEGGFFILTKEATDVIASIDAGAEESITMSVFGIGLGILTDMPVITVSAECAEGSSVEESVEARIVFSTVTIIE